MITGYVHCSQGFLGECYRDVINRVLREAEEDYSRMLVWLCRQWDGYESLLRNTRVNFTSVY